MANEEMERNHKIYDLYSTVVILFIYKNLLRFLTSHNEGSAVGSVSGFGGHPFLPLTPYLSSDHCTY